MLLQIQDIAPLEVGDEFLDGAEPLLLGLAGAVAVPGELRGDLTHANGVGEFEKTTPVGHLGGALPDGKVVTFQVISGTETVKEATKVTLQFLPYTLMTTILFSIVFSYFYSKKLVKP